MKIKCSQYVLNRVLNTVSKAITNRTTIPILKGILITATADNKIKLTATDSEISIEKECECEVIEPGQTVVSAKLLTEMVRKLPDDDIYIEEKDTVINVKCRSYKSDIVAFPADEFPAISEIEENDKIILNKDSFRKMIKKTSFAASTDESRGVLTGILTEIKNGELSMVAIDGFRMSMAREAINTDKDSSFIISAKLYNEISKIMSDENDEEEFAISMDNKKAVFHIGTTVVTTRLLEGSFINYKDIVPKSNECRVTADRKDLIGVIDRASLIVSEGKNNLIKMNIKDNMMNISSRSEEGHIEENMSVEIEGSGLEIGFNSRYIMDVMKVIDDEEIVMEFISNVTPCMIKPKEGNSFEFLVLPVRITS